MHVYFESDNTSGEPLRELVIRRAQAASRRLSYAVLRTKVKFTDVFGRTGTSDKQCRVELTVGDRGTVIAIARGADWRAALDGALSRAAKILPGFKRRTRIGNRWASRGRHPDIRMVKVAVK